MKIYALLSFFDENPEHLTRCVKSLAGFCDHLIAVDGPYVTFDFKRAYSAQEQRQAIRNAAQPRGLSVNIHYKQGTEVGKRAAMFEYGRAAGATPDDWFLIVDADMALAEFTPEARDLLAASGRDVAEVRWQDMQVNGLAVSTNRFRSMFRALPGLTVERTHYLYTVPIHCDCPEFECKGKRRFLWHAPNGQLADEPIVDLFGHVTLHHFNSQRDPERKRRALDYYQDRDARTLESAGDWR